MYYIGLDVHKKTISYCVKDAAGEIHQEGKIGSTRRELDAWIQTLPQPWMMAMEATIFTGWIYDHLLPHAEKVKVAHPLMRRAIAAAKKKNDRIELARLPTARGATFWPSAIWLRRRFEIGEGSHQLLLTMRGREELCRQGNVHADFQAKEQAHPTRTGGSRQAGAPVLPRTGPAPGEGNSAREQKSGHPGGSQEAGGLHARGGPQETGFRAGRRVGDKSSDLKNPS